MEHYLAVKKRFYTCMPSIYRYASWKTLRERSSMIGKSKPGGAQVTLRILYSLQVFKWVNCVSMNIAVTLLLRDNRSGCSPVPAHHTAGGIVPLGQSLLGTTGSPALNRRGQSSVCSGSLLSSDSSPSSHSTHPQVLSMGVSLLGLDTVYKSQVTGQGTWACHGAQCWAGEHGQLTRPLTTPPRPHLHRFRPALIPQSLAFSFPPCLPLLVPTATQTWLYQEETDEEYTWSSKKSHLKGHLSCDHSHTPQVTLRVPHWEATHDDVISDFRANANSAARKKQHSS